MSARTWCHPVHLSVEDVVFGTTNLCIVGGNFKLMCQQTHQIYGDRAINDMVVETIAHHHPTRIRAASNYFKKPGSWIAALPVAR
jgi:hypothetical protein